MLWLLSFSYATWALLGFLSVFLLIIFTDRKAQKQGKAPGPYKLPILGNLLQIAKYPDPSVAFEAIAKEFGDIVSLKLGSLDCLVVTGMEKTRSILHTKGHLFDSRPDFQRHNLLFGGDKNNSIAFSNWSDLQRRRRDLIKNHTFPKQYSSIFEHLDSIAGYHISEMVSSLSENGPRSTVYIKPLLMETLGKVFVSYFTSTEITEENHEDFLRMIEAFDYIFQEVNEGCVGDVFPSLMFMCNKSHLTNVSENVRNFVMKHCVEPRFADREMKTQSQSENENQGQGQQQQQQDMNINLNLKPNRHSMANMSSMNKEFNTEDDHSPSINGGEDRIPHRHSEPNLAKMDFNNNNMEFGQNDLLDTFLNNVGKENVTLDVALYALEDILGGHSAIANMLTKLFVLLGQNPEVQDRIRYEVMESVGKNAPVTLFNRLPYTEATMWEGVRHIASPIVPHVAVADTTIDDYAVPKGTVIFINNRDMHFSPTLWKEPEKFAPERFITAENLVVKPEFFIPFSTGRRSCMGYKMVQYLTFLCLANICQKFSIELDPTESYKIASGNLAVKGQGFRFILNEIST